MAWTFLRLSPAWAANCTAKTAVARLAPLDEAGADEIAFVTGAKHADALRASAAGAVIVKADLLDIAARPAIVCADPYVFCPAGRADVPAGGACRWRASQRGGGR